ncbi:WD repeat-containing protein 55 homolog [Neocloeon triangulifer]|uniref:WD repeat-containing protein 55 homolog n=1 Tax=Neocloeon triangulifer TaxID=2078957 RepID=UPI00286F0077|nr:WD repeat-containing protein 55 homolog [Neocloeon triangulifer]
MKGCTGKSANEEFKEEEDSSDDSSNDEIEQDSDDGSIDSDSDDDSEGNKGVEEDDGDEDDDIIKAFRKAREVKRDKPPDITCDDPVADLSFHPGRDVIAAATLEGDILLYSYSNESCDLQETIEVHTQACRCIEFSEDGDSLFSISKDKSIVVSDCATGKMKRFNEEAHSDPLYILKIIDENRFATGDENGTVKIWDLRQKDAIFSLKEMEDTVNDMITTEAKRFLVCSAGEGTITSIDLNSRKLHVQSEVYDSELTSLALVKQDRKLVVGSGKGIFYFFDWGSFGYHSDEFPGPKQSINTMKGVTQNIVVTGMEDGVLRATHLFPHKLLGVVGTHSSSVESMDVSCDGELLASSGFDNTIKFWNIKYFEGLKISEREKNDKKVLNHNLPSSNVHNAGDFFKDMV